MKKALLFFAFSSLACSIAACDDSSDSSPCKNYCDNNTAYTCDDGKVSSQDCGNDSCVNGTCIPKKVCNNGEIQCSAAGVPQKCINNTWGDQKACSVDQICVAGNCEPDPEYCTNDRLSCDKNGIPVKCVNHRWATQTPCGSNSKCDGGTCKTSTGNDTVCSGNAKRCLDGKPQICTNNTWKDSDACILPQICSNGDCIDQPIPSELSCTKTEETKCQTVNGQTWAFSCSEGEVLNTEWDFPENCTASGLVCKVSTDPETQYTQAWCGCTSNDSCHGETPLCNLKTNRCVTCLSNNDCSGSTPVCDTEFGGDCVECVTAQDCAGRTDLTNPTCDEFLECVSGSKPPSPSSTGLSCADTENGDICQTDKDNNIWRVVCVDNQIIYDDGYGFHITTNCTAAGKTCTATADGAECTDAN